MIRVQDQHAHAFLADLAAISGDGSNVGTPVLGRSFELALGNLMDYAVYLHEKEGYSVINVGEWISTVEEFLAAHLASGKPLTEAALAGTMLAATEDTVRYFQEFIPAFQPPLRKGLPERPKHAGGLNWADRTTKLASAYFAVLTAPSGQRWTKTYDYDGVRYDRGSYTNSSGVSS